MKRIEASVVIPSYNAAHTLPAQLLALATQTCHFNFEVIVADNGSTDSTVSVVDKWSVLWPDVRRVDASKVRGVSHARNQGVRASNSEYVLICDADDVVSDVWVETLLGGLKTSDLVCGSLDAQSINHGPEKHWRNLPPAGQLPWRLDFLPYAHGNNMGLRKKVFETVGGWDEELIAGGDDIDFSWRAQLSGFTIAPVRDAVVAYKFRESATSGALQGYRYTRSDELLLEKFVDKGLKVPKLSLVTLEFLRYLAQFPKFFLGSRIRGRWLYAIFLTWGRVQALISYRVLGKKRAGR